MNHEQGDTEKMQKNLNNDEADTPEADKSSEELKKRI